MTGLDVILLLVPSDLHQLKQFSVSSRDVQNILNTSGPSPPAAPQHNLAAQTVEMIEQTN